MTLTAILTAVFGWGVWFFKLFFFAGWTLVKTVLWLLSPIWLVGAIVGVISGCLTTPAKASWLWGSDPRFDAANRALEQAAHIATEAARTQSSQQTQLLAAVEALSNERTQLAQHLLQLGEMAARDSSWAAALHALGPVLIATAVLVLGSAAIWLVTRSGDRDTQLADLLVEEVSGSSRLHVAPRAQLEDSTHDQVAAEQALTNLIDIKPGYGTRTQHPEPQEMPF
jgi:hypothetical protein